ncbi:MAG TPA: endo alpha-1,4 polygalactosaminidase [Paludibacteraceae bacterium]|nr:endo alpha-1,4 polygalactosaminidase [Paludibacteraceae bacterium]HRS68075.1 endo alpha-1,4 polygalactosaminidase [Paludibacteraceae bacterium]
MKKIIYLSFCIGLFACKPQPIYDYKEEMRNFVCNLSAWAKAQKSLFLIIPQNGIELVTVDGTATGLPAITYLNAIDGHGQEDLFYGYNTDNEATPKEVTNYLISFLTISQRVGNIILTTDYCSAESKMADSYAQNTHYQFLSFAAPERELDAIPNHPIYHENKDTISSLEDAKNFLYLINPENFPSKQAFVEAVCSTNYDVLIMDLFFQNEIAFTANEIEQLRVKTNGGRRLVIAYMSIGEAEKYRYYWKSSWNVLKPQWLDAENPDWEGNYKVKYWDKAWQSLIFGNDDSYLQKILNANFDGVYLDIIDAFEYYENR